MTQNHRWCASATPVLSHLVSSEAQTCILSFAVPVLSVIPVCLLCEPESVPAWSPSARSRSVCPCPHVCPVCFSLSVGFAYIYWTAQRIMRRERRDLYEIYMRLSQGSKWSQLSQTANNITNITVYQVASVYWVKHLWWISIYKIPFNLYLLLLANEYHTGNTCKHIYMTLGSKYKRIYNLRL